MPYSEQVVEIAQTLVDTWPNFFVRQGPGVGDRATNAFMAELRTRAASILGHDFAEQRISGDNNLAVDYYFPDEGTILEIAMSLRNPGSEFERDILKAIMAQEAGSPVRRLLFLAKPGAVARHSQPSSRAIVAWAERAHGIAIEIREFTSQAERILDQPAE